MSLYVGGKRDLPLGYSYVEKHLQKCSACDEVHQSYQARRQDVSELKNNILPSDLFDDYWEQIQAKLEEPPQKQKVFTRDVFKTPWFPIRPVAAFAACLVVIAIVVAGPLTTISPSPNATASVNPGGSFWWWSNLLGEQPIEIDTDAFYKIEHVVPCRQEEEVSF